MIKDIVVRHTTKTLELLTIAIMLKFMNWFTFEMVTRYETSIPPMEITWVVGLFTGLIIMAVVSEYEKN